MRYSFSHSQDQALNSLYCFLKWQREDTAKRRRKWKTKVTVAHSTLTQKSNSLDDTTTLTFSLMTIFLSMGRYSKGKIIRQLKLPLPSKDLKNGEKLFLKNGSDWTLISICFWWSLGGYKFEKINPDFKRHYRQLYAQVSQNIKFNFICGIVLLVSKPNNYLIVLLSNCLLASYHL